MRACPEYSRRDDLLVFIQRLRRRLQMLFGIADDPFYPYWQVNTYRTRFQLEPLTSGQSEDEPDDI